MLSHHFAIMRDAKRQYIETDVTEERVGPAIHLLTESICNVRIDIEGVTDATALSIRFEQSEDGNEWDDEIGTFPIPDEHHGIIFAKFKEYVRYVLLVDGADQPLTVSVWF